MKKVLPYLITAVVGAIIVVAVICGYSVWNITDRAQVIQLLSDAFFVAGVCIGGIGLLVFASNHGLFDMLSYAVKLIFTAIVRKERKYKDYKEYRDAREAKKKTGTAFMLIIGLGFIAVAAIFLIIYYNL